MFLALVLPLAGSLLHYSKKKKKNHCKYVIKVQRRIAQLYEFLLPKFKLKMNLKKSHDLGL